MHNENAENSQPEKSDVEALKGRGFILKRELDTTDLIKSLVVIIGAIFAFCFVTSVQLKNERLTLENESQKLKLELTKVLPTLQPHVQANVSNQVNPNNSNIIDIRLYLKVISKHSLYYFPPKISLIKKGTDDQAYEGRVLLHGVKDYKGLFSPGTEYNINYSLEVEDDSILKEYDLVLTFDVDTDEKIQKAYMKILSVLGDRAEQEIDEISYKTHRFREKIHEDNPGFDVFFQRASGR